MNLFRRRLPGGIQTFPKMREDDCCDLDWFWCRGAGVVQGSGQDGWREAEPIESPPDWAAVMGFAAPANRGGWRNVVPGAARPTSRRRPASGFGHSAEYLHNLSAPAPENAGNCG